jgi:hypothetical protein
LLIFTRKIGGALRKFGKQLPSVRVWHDKNVLLRRKAGTFTATKGRLLAEKICFRKVKSHTPRFKSHQGCNKPLAFLELIKIRAAAFCVSLHRSAIMQEQNKTDI